MRKTEILDLTSRKLIPFMFLFGFYLLSYGHLSPGGGFQGGVVIASAVILLSVSRGIKTAERLFPFRRLSQLEAVSFLLLLSVGTVGIAAGVGFLGNPVPLYDPASGPRLSMLLVLNILIGLKVGAGISLICMRLFQGE